MRPRLRIFTGDDEPAYEPPKVTVPLREITMALTDAVQTNRTWLLDFEDDEVNISEDLYQIISAYWHLRPSA